MHIIFLTFFYKLLMMQKYLKYFILIHLFKIILASNKTYDFQKYGGFSTKKNYAVFNPTGFEFGQSMYFKIIADNFNEDTLYYEYTDNLDNYTFYDIEDLSSENLYYVQSTHKTEQNDDDDDDDNNKKKESETRYYTIVKKEEEIGELEGKYLILYFDVDGLAKIENTKTDEGKLSFIFGLIVSIIAIVVIGVIVYCCYCRKKKKSNDAQEANNVNINQQQNPNNPGGGNFSNQNNQNNINYNNNMYNIKNNNGNNMYNCNNMNNNMYNINNNNENYMYNSNNMNNNMYNTNISNDILNKNNILNINKNNYNNNSIDTNFNNNQITNQDNELAPNNGNIQFTGLQYSNIPQASSGRGYTFKSY